MIVLGVDTDLIVDQFTIRNSLFEVLEVNQIFPTYKLRENVLKSVNPYTEILL